MFDFNVVITNPNKMNKSKALELVTQLRSSITASKQAKNEYADEYYSHLPLVGKTIFDQQQLLYTALFEWIDTFEKQFKEE